MKLTFTFTDSPDLASLSKDDIYTTHFDIPDEALHLIGVRERVLKVAELVGELTDVYLHFSCVDLDIKYQPITTTKIKLGLQVARSPSLLLIAFELPVKHRTLSKSLKILGSYLNIHSDHLYSSKLVVSKRGRISSKRTPRKFIPLNFTPRNDSETEHKQKLMGLIQQCLVLLGAAPASEQGGWQVKGFNPYYEDAALSQLQKKRQKAAQKAKLQEQKAEERRIQREAKLAEKGITPDALPQTGAGRRVGAVPGVFKGVQFRSQLEIRFVTELEERGVKWIYEGERLGGGNYLVDFYLPEYGAWVEVKGRFEPRDKFLLQEVATLLKTERKERLFVFTSSKPMLVNPSGFRELARADFWELLLK